MYSLTFKVVNLFIYFLKNNIFIKKRLKKAYNKFLRCAFHHLSGTLPAQASK